MCQMHHWRLKVHGDAFYAERAWHVAKSCAVAGCTGTYKAKGLCEGHYQRLRKYGRLEPLPRALAPKRYRLKVMRGHPLAHRGTGRVYVHRAVLYEAIGAVRVPCFWCGRPLRWTTEKPVPADGIIPDHLDGDRHNNSPENLVPACSGCNCRRTRVAPLKPVYA